MFIRIYFHFRIICYLNIHRSLICFDNMDFNPRRNDMSRSWNFYGLSAQAHQFLNDNLQLTEFEETVTRTYADGRVHSTTRKLQEESWQKGIAYSEHQPWFDEPLHLKSYVLKNGQTVYEYVQEEPWSSGPCTFVALSYSENNRDNNPVESTLWSQRMIADYIGSDY
jgi:hypothetical protein